jgi:hypothetical protein
VTPRHVGLLAPGQRPSVSATGESDVSGLLAMAASAADGTDVSAVLVTMGVPEGEARFYVSELREGRTLLVVDAHGQSDAVRNVVLEHGGYDVQSRGRDFIRGDGTTTRGTTGRSLPVDVTDNWQDVRSRYEMLWQQHYGTTDATFEQMEPIYRYAWELANDARYRGRRWRAVERAVRRDYDSSRLPSFTWEHARGPIRDVWEDVAQEAAMGAEGGADRRITRQGTDQSTAARDLLPPRHDAT